MPLTPRQETHLQTIIATAQELLDKKFRAGATEHKGDLQDMPLVELLENALQENIDQFTYLLTAIQKAKNVIVVGGVHTPNRVIKNGEHDIECRVCWNTYGKNRCKNSVAVTPKPNGFFNYAAGFCPQCKLLQIDCSCNRASATA